MTTLSENIVQYQQQRQCADKRSLCHAPTYGIHLAQNGLVSVCSLTRFDAIGKYPESSLGQIWWGEKAQNMRNALRKGQFPESCRVCQSDVEAGQFQQMRAANYDIYALAPFEKFKQRTFNFLKNRHFGEFPKEMSFELANTCNLECIMCLGMLSSSIRQNRDKLPPLPQHYGPELLEELKLFIPHLHEARFFGGEPFLIPLYLDIWELFMELNPDCKIYITTNGTILNNRVKNILEKLSNFHLVISLDGITKPTFEAIRQNANFERVIENLSYFREVCEKHGNRLIISPTYMVQNWQEYPLLLDFANQNNLVFQTNILITPTELSLAHAPLELLEKVLINWEQHQAATALDSQQGENNVKAFQGALSQIRFWMEEIRAFQGNPIGAALASFVPQNKMELCLVKRLISTLRNTQDPAFPLRLLELWAEPDEQPGLTYLNALEHICSVIYPSQTLSNLSDTRDYFASFDMSKQLNMVKFLLLDLPPWEIFELWRRNDLNAIQDCLKKANLAADYPSMNANFY